MHSSQAGQREEGSSQLQAEVEVGPPTDLTSASPTNMNTR